jgi:hypothetical protein
MRQYLMKAVQDDAQRAGERDRLLLEARRAHVARRPRARPAAPVRRLARLPFTPVIGYKHSQAHQCQHLAGSRARPDVRDPELPVPSKAVQVQR